MPMLQHGVRAMGRADDLIEAARAGNYPLVERILRWGEALWFDP